jgi:hypothetical protein
MKVSSVKKDASEVKFIPTIPPKDVKETSRVSRQSSLLYTPANNIKYQSHFLPVSVLVNGGVTTEQEGSSGNGAHYISQQVQEHYQNLSPKQQQQVLAAIRAAKQPKSPVYHATPLEPYGALLKHASGPKYEEKTVLVTPKPIVEHHQGDQSGTEEAGGHSYYATSTNSVGKHTEVVIPETKYAPLAYKSLHQHHQTLHHHDDYEEPKNVSQRIEFN